MLFNRVNGKCRLLPNNGFKTCLSFAVACLLAGATLFPTKALCALAQGDVPEMVKIKPVFFVPKYERGPTKTQVAKLTRHLRLARKVFRQMLKNRDTFQIEEGGPIIVQGRGAMSSYKSESQRTITYQPLSEIFAKCRWNRFNCPYVLVIVMMNSRDKVPRGAGRPFNRGFNSGGGLVVISSWSLDHNPVFQGTLQHELGHSFGLVHVEAYGYDQRNNPSIMSYIQNPWNGFTPTRYRGRLIPEDFRALAKNKKVFPNFYFDPATDVPSGYKLFKNTVRLSAKGKFPGQKDYQIKTETDSGEANGSLVSNIVHNMILPKDSAFSAKRMWLSEKTETQWVNATLTFPVPVSLCKIAVHTQFSDKYHIANGVKIAVLADAGFQEICKRAIDSPDAYVSFPPQTGAVWRFSFLAGSSRQVVIRGLRFFSSPTNEIFCPTYPYMEPTGPKKSAN